MLTRAIAGANRHGDTALGPRAGAVSESFFGDENYREALRGEPPRRPETGYSGAYYYGAG
jgi:hypothetical protein